MAKTVVEERRVVAAPPDVVFTVLTTPADMVGWLCNEARCEARPGGLYELRWNNGYTVHGKVAAVSKPANFTVAWHGSGEPGETTVSFTLKAKGKRTQVAVRHTGFSRAAKWAQAIERSSQGWKDGLDSLQHLVETGIDLREARRPMLGIYIGELLDAEKAAKEGIGAQSGIYLEGVVDGLSAQAAGLKAHDVITAVGGQPVPDFATLTVALQRHVAGDRIQVDYVRGPQHQSVSLELKPRPMPEVPADQKALVAMVKELCAKAQAKLAEVMAGVSEEKAGRAPAEGAWSAKQVLAHLIVTECDYRYYRSDLLLGVAQPDGAGNPSALPEKIAAVLAVTPTIPALLKRLEQEQAEAVATLAALRPEFIVNKARYRRIAMSVLDLDDHVDEHVDQIKAALAKK